MTTLCPLHGHNVDKPDYGYVSQILQPGTANASGVTQQMSQVQWMPIEGPIAYDEIAKNYQGHLTEIKGEIRNG